MSSKVFSKARLIGCALASLALAGCAAVDPGMGEAMKYNALAQTVNPDPVYGPDGAQPGDSGNLGQKASERYRKDAVKAVVRESTQSGSGGGGSGSK